MTPEMKPHDLIRLETIFLNFFTNRKMVVKGTQNDENCQFKVVTTLIWHRLKYSPEHLQQINFVEKLASNRPKADRGGFKFCLRMSPKSAEADNSGFYVYYSIFLKNEPQIGQRPIKGNFIFIFNFAEKWAPNRL